LLAVGDITSEELRKQLVGDTVKKFGRIDILVNWVDKFNPRIFFSGDLIYFVCCLGEQCWHGHSGVLRRWAAEQVGSNDGL
jgi:NAD(P)-dependent dehydrogenase (short-subunit alcohol dehydrogenase family)